MAPHRRRALAPLVALALALALAIPSAASADTPPGPTPEEKAFQEQLQATPTAKTYDFDDANIDGALGSGSMRRANRAAAEIVNARMARDRAADLELLKSAAAADIVVIAGSYDRVQDVLAAVGVKRVTIPPELVDQLDLIATQTVMVNCPGNLSPAGVARIERFVARGGYLVTTDWALLNLVQRAFPGTIAFNGRATADDVVAVHVHDPDEPLLSHVKVMGDQPRWWLETASHPVSVLDPRRVRVLMSSDEMKARYGEGAVVVAFDHGDGHVLHMTSHFFLQRSQALAASEQQGGKAFAKAAGLTDAQIAELEAKGVDVGAVSAGELNSAYSMQQFSTNLLVTKQKANAELVKKYGKTVIADAPLLAVPGGAPGGAGGTVKAGFRVKVLAEDGDWARVRDLFGHEGWVREDNLR